MLHALFWFSAIGLLYIYAGYPVWAQIRARLFPRAIAKAPFRATVSVVISVYGEAAKLEAKLRSLLALEDAECIEQILVGSDGSPDDVVAVAKRIADPRIRVFPFRERRGKPSVLNDLMQQCTGEIVLMTDARQPLDRLALRALLANFSDPAIGVVSGELVLVSGPDATTAAQGIDAYWRYEKMIRKSESVSGSVPGATGALYAIRRSLLRPIPPHFLLDDVAIPLQAIRAGSRCVFEPAALVYDQPESDPSREALRKRRTIAGTAQLAWEWPWLLNPFRNPIWFDFLSHKVLRLFSPLFLLALGGSNLLLLSNRYYLGIAAAQTLFYAIAALGCGLNHFGIKAGLVGIPFMFIRLNISTLQAIGDAMSGKFEVRWARSRPV